MRNKTKLTRKQMRILKRNSMIGLIVLLMILLFFSANKVKELVSHNDYWELSDEEITSEKPEIMVDLLDLNEYSRPGKESDKITGIVIHYTANPGSTAKQNRDYFNGLAKTHTTKASSHFIVGLEGEIVQCVPTWEIAYASNERNKNTVSIECCHPDESGVFNKETYQSMVQLTAWLCEKFGLYENDVIRHYDVTGKNCPKYFVEDEEAWDTFRLNIKKALESVEE